MSIIGNPLPIPELSLTPEPTGGIQLSDDMRQTLSLIAGFWRNKRVLLKASPSGVLFVTQPQIADIIHVTATGTNFAYQGTNIECADVLVMGHPDNTGKIWVKPYIPATTDNGLPLSAGDAFGFALTNLGMLNILIAVSADVAIIAYSM